MSQNAAKILLTGFGPFPGVPCNISAALVTALADTGATGSPSLAITALILPTNWRRAPALVFKTLNELRPDLVLHFGVARSATGFVIETLAHNTTCDLHDDKDELPTLACLQVGGPKILNTAFDGERLAARLRAKDIAAKTSDDAGAYLCNAVFYQSLLFAKDHAPDMISAFVHLPDLLDGAPSTKPNHPAAGQDRTEQQGKRRSAAHSSLTWENAVAGGRDIIASLTQTSAAPE